MPTNKIPNLLVSVVVSLYNIRKKLVAYLLNLQWKTLTYFEFVTVKNAGCHFIPLLSERFTRRLARNQHAWQMRDLTLRQSDGLLASDPVSAAGVRCESSGDASALLRLLRRMEDPAPETDAVAESLSGALAGFFESHRDHYLAPSPEGESFLPFYRKVDKVLTGLMPWGSRRRRVIAGTLARWYIN